MNKKLYYMACYSYLFSLLLVTYYCFFNQETVAHYSIISVVLLYLPILFPMIGIFKSNPYTHAWSVFIAALYLMIYLTELWLSRDLLSLLTTGSLLCWIISSTYFARSEGIRQGLSIRNKKKQ